MSASVETLQTKVLAPRPRKQRPWKLLLIAVTAAGMAGASTNLALRGDSKEAAPRSEIARPAPTNGIAPSELGGRSGTESVTVRKVEWEPGRFENYWGPNDPDLGFNRVGGYQSIVRSTESSSAPGGSGHTGPSGTSGDPGGAGYGCTIRSGPC
jgi:hypothetical protein